MIKAEVSLKAKDPESLKLMKLVFTELISYIPQIVVDKEGREWCIFNSVPIKWNKLEVNNGS